MSKQVNLTIALVLNADGSTDEAASEKAFRAALTKHISESETQKSTVAAAVLGQFAKFPGEPITMPTLGSMVCASLNAVPANHATLEKVALDYVRANASEKREDGKLFRIGKGKNGGVQLWSDIPVKAPAAPAADAAPAAQ